MAAAGYEGGGAGGKFRKKPAKKVPTTPYDRPLGRNPSLISKLIVDPALKLLNAGYQRFKSSLSIKRITGPPVTSPVVNQEAKATSQESVIPSPAIDQGPAVSNRDEQGVFGKQALKKDSGKQIMTNGNGGGLSELELMLKQKTFTRSEIDRLTELLHSRTVESSNGDREKNTEFLPLSVSGSRGKDNFARSSLQETRNESHLDNHRFDGRVSTVVVSSKVLEEDVATPAELAKAYMGNRSSKVSPSVLGLRSQATREDPGALCSSPFTPRSPVMSLVQKPSVYGGVHDNGFITPRSRGRSAIYSMARTPYSRIHPTASLKGNSSTYDGYGGSSASPSTGFARELVARSVSKDMALKRRSSVLEDEIGSVGPIRRLRQKTNLSTPKNMSFPVARTPYSSQGTGIVANGTLDPSSSSKTFQGSKDNENMPGTSCTPVPSQSKETARKILQQLEKLAPKEKQLEDKVGAVNENSPSKLMPNMLHGQALRSLENVDSSKILQGAGYDFNYKQKGPLTDACETSSSRRHDKIEENGPRNSNVSNGSLAPVETGNGTVVSKDAVPAFSFTDTVKKQAVTQPSQKKWGFQMSAHEDFLEQDDEIHSYEAAAPAKLVEEKKFTETSVVGSKAVSAAEDKTSSASEFKAPNGSSEIGKATGFGASDGTRKVDISSGSVFSDAPAASMSFPSVVSVSKSTTFANSIPDQGPSAPPPVLFSSGAKTDDKVAPNTFSSSPFGGGSFGLKSTASAEVKQDFTNSLAANTSDATETVTKPTDLVNGSVENLQKPRDAVGKSENVFSLPQSTSASTSSLFTVGSKATFSSLSKDSLNSTAPSNVPLLPTSDFGGQTLSASTGSVFTVGSNPSFSSLSNGALKSTTPTSEPGNQTPPNLFTGFAFNSTAASSEAATPSFSATTSSLLPPAFKFASTSNSTPSTTTNPTAVADFKPVSSFVAPPTYATVSTTSSATDVKGSTEKETSLGNLNSNPFSAPSSQMTGSGSSVFAFNAGSTSSPSAASLSQGSLFGTSSGASISTQSVSVLGASAPSSAGFSFGAQPSAFASSAGASASSSPFSFSSTAQKQPAFSNNGDKMTMADDSMSDDPVQAGPTTPSFPVSGQLPASNPSPSPFVFGGTTPSTSGVSPFQFGGQPSQPSAQNPNPFQFGGQPSQSSAQNPNPFQFGGQPSQPSAQNPNPFQFGGQPSQPSPQNPNPFQFGGQPSQPSTQNPNPFQFGGQLSQPSAQNPNPFQPSGSQDFAAGGSFSLGSVGGGDKSGRRVVKVSRKNRRK